MGHDPEVQTGVRHGARNAALEHGGVLPPPELRVQAAGLGRERFGSEGCSLGYNRVYVQFSRSRMQLGLNR